MPDETPRRTVGAGATLATASQIATALTGGVMGIVVARLLGPAETGSFSVAVSGLGVLSLLATFGVHAGATYFVSRRLWAPGDALRQTQLGAFALGVAVGALSAAAVVLFGIDTGGASELALVLLFACVPFAVSWTCTSFVALASDHYESFALASVGANLAALILVVALAPGLGLSGAIAGLAAAQIVNALLLFAWERRHQPPAESGWAARAPAELRRAVGFGSKAYLTQLFALVNARADLFILALVVGGADVGHYAIALAITELGLLLPRGLNAVVFPRVAALERGVRDEHQQMVIVKSVRHALLQAPLMAAGLVVALLAVPLVYGRAFAPALEPGLILIPGALALGLANVLSASVTGRGFPQYAVYGWAAVTPLAVLLYVVLIPGLETIGAALASTLVYSLNLALTAYYFERTAGVARLRELLPGKEELADYRLVAARLSARLRSRTTSS